MALWGRANDTNFNYEKGKGFDLELNALMECTSMERNQIEWN